ncbi:hypothetical protein [Actinoallomurus sp. CA-150999]|uniref:hypothetical protein n=1 Tax=Actinoallomurus sp. CA-150999 TaxID=3239887 RepID=UPI003D911C58
MTATEMLGTLSVQHQSPARNLEAAERAAAALLTALGVDLRGERRQALQPAQQ